MVREAFEQELNEWVAKVKKEGPLREDVLYKFSTQSEFLTGHVAVIVGVGVCIALRRRSWNLAIIGAASGVGYEVSRRGLERQLREDATFEPRMHPALYLSASEIAQVGDAEARGRRREQRIAMLRTSALKWFMLTTMCGAIMTRASNRLPSAFWARMKADLDRGAATRYPTVRVKANAWDDDVVYSKWKLRPDFEVLTPEEERKLESDVEIPATPPPSPPSTDTPPRAQ